MTHTPIHLTSPVAPVADREIAVLRALGRLGMLDAQTLRQLLFWDRHRSRADRLLAGLLEHGLMWQARSPGLPHVRPDGSLGPPSSRRVFGLTSEGKVLLEQVGAEAQGPTFERLLSRNTRTPNLPQTTLAGELLAASWCASVIDQARRAPMLVGVTCQAQFVTHREQASGKAVQMLSAYLALIFDPAQRTYGWAAWDIPWWDGPVSAQQRVVRLGLQVDTGKAALATVIQEARAWAVLASQGAYTRLFGGPVRPVLLTVAGARARAVLQAYQDAWPESPALLASSEKADHPTYGALWGSYTAVRDARPASLLGEMVPSIEQWAALTAGWGKQTGS